MWQRFFFSALSNAYFQNALRFREIDLTRLIVCKKKNKSRRHIRIRVTYCKLTRYFSLLTLHRILRRNDPQLIARHNSLYTYTKIVREQI